MLAACVSYTDKAEETRQRYGNLDVFSMLVCLRSYGLCSWIDWGYGVERSMCVPQPDGGGGYLPLCRARYQDGCLSTSQHHLEEDLLRSPRALIKVGVSRHAGAISRFLMNQELVLSVQFQSHVGSINTPDTVRRKSAHSLVSIPRWFD